MKAEKKKSCIEKQLLVAICQLPDLLALELFQKINYTKRQVRKLFLFVSLVECESQAWIYSIVCLTDMCVCVCFWAICERLWNLELAYATKCVTKIVAQINLALKTDFGIHEPWNIMMKYMAFRCRTMQRLKVCTVHNSHRSLAKY